MKQSASFQGLNIDKNSIIKLSQIRGSEIGVDFAEAYHLHRLFF